MGVKYFESINIIDTGVEKKDKEIRQKAHAFKDS